MKNKSEKRKSKTKFDSNENCLDEISLREENK